MVEARDFLDYFLFPQETGYDIPKTMTYTVVLLLTVYLIYITLKKLKVKPDRKLALGISPYVIFGGTMRVLQDAGLLSSWWFVTPGIYFFVYFLVFFILLVSLFLEKKAGIPYFKPLFVSGLFMVGISIAFIKPINFLGAGLVLAFFLPWVLIFRFVRWNVSNKAVTLLHTFDATTTFVALQFFGYLEQHVVPTAVISLFSPLSFIFLKIAAVVVVLILIDRFSNDKEFNNYLKIIIGVLGAATGSRDFITLLALV